MTTQEDEKNQKDSDLMQLFNIGFNRKTGIDVMVMGAVVERLQKDNGLSGKEAFEFIAAMVLLKMG